MTAEALTDLLTKQNQRSHTKLTPDVALQMIADYQAGAPVQPLLRQYGISQNRFYAILAGVGVPQRSKAESLAMWYQNKNKSEISVNGRGGGNTVKPPTQRHAAPTPRERWVDVTYFCQTCGSIFGITAPSNVAARLYIVWKDKHPCAFFEEARDYAVPTEARGNSLQPASLPWPPT